MIIHCSQKLAAKLPGVSSVPLDETSPLGSWHGHLLTLDRRQCVLFCHDTSRAILFIPGLRKEDFANLGKLFRPLCLAMLAVFDCAPGQIRKAELAMGPLSFDTATDRSVQGSIRIVQQELEWMAADVPVMDLDPLAISCRLTHRPTTIHGKSLWPDLAMLDAVARL
ncbi:MAG: hypothetical protein COX17_03770 [Deltaproteobacteria bacterium CG23_combo_of_CG06-09_8_20_14_all_60_8]|nr:MAG: hypothetical protein COX17_03770 [Deltaproteobacteria bacterium CG23_combo_of_CG06-09_8_20_14_all_60_8]